MTAGAQHRIVVRRRRRIAAGLAAAVAMTTLGVFAVTRNPEQLHNTAAVKPETPPVLPATDLKHDPWDSNNPPSDESADEDVRALVQLANTDRSAKLSTNWGHITKPLAPYRSLLRGVSHE